MTEKYKYIYYTTNVKIDQNDRLKFGFEIKYLQVCVISSSSGIDSVFSSEADILLLFVLTDYDFTIFLAHNIDIKSDEAIWSSSVYTEHQQSLKFSKQSKVVKIWKSW